MRKLLKQYDKEWSELAPEEDYSELITNGVTCSCGSELSKDEILSHRYAGITERENMCCQKCWIGIAYDINYNNY